MKLKNISYTVFNTRPSVEKFRDYASVSELLISNLNVTTKSYLLHYNQGAFITYLFKPTSVTQGLRNVLQFIDKLTCKTIYKYIIFYAISEFINTAVNTTPEQKRTYGKSRYWWQPLRSVF